MRISESKLRRIIRKVILESSDPISIDAQRVVSELSRDPYMKILFRRPEYMREQLHGGMVQEKIRQQVEAVCGNGLIDGQDGYPEDHCAAVQDTVTQMLDTQSSAPVLPPMENI